jgi:hypothetical protein
MPERIHLRQNMQILRCDSEWLISTVLRDLELFDRKEYEWRFSEEKRFTVNPAGRIPRR